MGRIINNNNNNEESCGISEKKQEQNEISVFYVKAGEHKGSVAQREIHSKSCVHQKRCLKLQASVLAFCLNKESKAEWIVK